MDINEKAKIIALAKTLGCEMTDMDTIEKYEQHYKETRDALNKAVKPTVVTTMSRADLGF